MSDADKKVKYQKRLVDLLARREQLIAKDAALGKKIAEVEALIAAEQ